MRKNWLKKLNHSILKKKTPLLGFTVLQFLILFLVLSGGGVVAVVLSQRQQPVTQNTGASLPTYDTDTPRNTPTVNTAPVENTPKSTSTQKSTASNATPDSGSTLDQYGCATNTPSYNQCVKTAKALWCNGQVSQPALSFSNATLQARSAYFTVMNEWQTEQYKTYHNPYSEYLDDATTKFNAIYEPAFATYTAVVQSLNSQGCTLQYPSHESAGQYG